MILLNHLPALQILIVFFGALFTIITNKNSARFIAIISITISLGLGSYCFEQIRQDNFASIYYHFGNFKAPIGIEYILDSLNQPLIIYINSVLLFLLLFCNSLVDRNILKYISIKRQNLFYSVLLFAHTGYIGIMSTNDIFNLYVFIEIASLSSYVLVSQGNHKQAAIGAFDYLILGTIGTTLILIAIGFLLEFTGSLNMSDIKERLHGHYDSKIVITGISFFLIGSILKTAFFPMHFWMIRSYLSAPTIILVYIAGISSVIGIYILLRFIHFTIEYNEIIYGLSKFLMPVTSCTMILCSLLALKAETVKKIAIYSCTTQIGYVFLLSIIPGTQAILLQFLLADSVNKVGLFFIISHIEAIGDYRLLAQHKIHCFLIASLLICSSALPISKMFIIKLNILDLLIKKDLWHNFVIIMISSSISLLYHYKIATHLFWSQKTLSIELTDAQYVQDKTSDNIQIQLSIDSMLYGLIFLIAIQLTLLFF
jgi:multicomponent Na+:H+ antiporter subunit D